MAKRISTTPWLESSRWSLYKYTVWSLCKKGRSAPWWKVRTNPCCGADRACWCWTMQRSSGIATTTVTQRSSVSAPKTHVLIFYNLGISKRFEKRASVMVCVNHRIGLFDTYRFSWKDNHVISPEASSRRSPRAQTIPKEKKKVVSKRFEIEVCNFDLCWETS